MMVINERLNDKFSEFTLTEFTLDVSSIVQSILGKRTCAVCISCIG